MAMSPLPSDTEVQTPSKPHDAIGWFELLNQLSRTINLSSGDLNTTLDLLMRRLIEARGVDAVAIWTIDPDTNFMSIHSSSGLSERYVRFFNKTDRIRVGQGLVGRVISDRKTLFVRSLGEYEHIAISRWNEMVAEENMRSILAAPMFVGESLVGAFNIYYKNNHDYTTDEILFTEVLANQIAVSLKNVENYELVELDREKLASQVERLTSIQQVMQQLNEHLTESIDASLPFLAEYLARQFESMSLQIFDYNSDSEVLTLVASHGNSIAFDAHVRQYHMTQESQTLVAHAVRTGQIEWSSRVFTDERIEKPLAVAHSKERIVAMAAVPLKAHDRTLGVLAVYYDHLHEFSDEEISVLSAFSQFLAISIEDINVFKSLADEKQKTESIVFSLHDGLLVYGLDGKIIEANPRAEEILGLRRSQLLGLDPRTLGESDPAYRNLRAVANLNIEEYGVQDVELPIPTGLTLRVGHVPLQTRQREKVGFIHLLHDITRERMAEKLKSNFVSTASHQFRTPLTGIKWGLMTLKSSKGLSEDQQSLIDQLLERSEHTIVLVNQLLDITRLEEGRTEYQFAERDIAEIAEHAIRESELDAKTANLTLSLQKPEEPLPKLIVDGEKLFIALKNLLDNAIKYTPEGGTVTMELSRGNSSVVIEVRDTGIGIPKESMNLLFHRFYRAENAIAWHSVGTGLGLFLVKSVIDRHGGRISADSVEGKGTVFTIQLPLGYDPRLVPTPGGAPMI